MSSNTAGVSCNAAGVSSNAAAESPNTVAESPNTTAESPNDAAESSNDAAESSNAAINAAEYPNDSESESFRSGEKNDLIDVWWCVFRSWIAIMWRSRLLRSHTDVRCDCGNCQS